MKKTSITIYDQSYPDTIEVSLYNNQIPHMNYIPERHCYIDVFIENDSSGVGTSRCSKCKKYIGLNSIYCSNCGSKVKSKRIIEKEGERI